MIVGPMYAGKTEELIRRVRRAVYAKQACATFKHSLDVRYSEDDIITHDGQSIQCVGAQSSNDLVSLWALRQEDAQVVAIDEVQFFDEGIVNFVSELIKAKKRVLIAGLDMDYTGAPFGSIPQLMAIADEVTKLKAVCSLCGSDAMFSKRLTNNTNQVLVGADKKYMAVCRAHFN